MRWTRFSVNAFLRNMTLVAALFVMAGGIGPGLDGSLLEPEPALADEAGAPRCIRCDPPEIESYSIQEIIQMWKEGIFPCGHEESEQKLGAGVLNKVKDDPGEAGAGERSRDAVTMFPSVFDHQVGDELYFKTTVPGWVPQPFMAFAILCSYYCMDLIQSGPVVSFTMSDFHASLVEREFYRCEGLGMTWRECHSEPYVPFTTEMTVNYVPSCQIDRGEIVRIEVGDVVEIQ